MSMLLKTTLALLLLIIGGGLTIRGLRQNKTVQTPKITSQSNISTLAYQSIGTLSSTQNSDSLTRGSRFSIEIVTTVHKAKAEKIVRKLSAAGLEAWYTPFNKGGRIVYKIRQGIYPQKNLARKQARRLEKRLKKRLKVVAL